jgi:hypothetical protein
VNNDCFLHDGLLDDDLLGYDLLGDYRVGHNDPLANDRLSHNDFLGDDGDDGLRHDDLLGDYRGDRHCHRLGHHGLTDLDRRVLRTSEARRSDRYEAKGDKLLSDHDGSAFRGLSIDKVERHVTT